MRKGICRPSDINHMRNENRTGEANDGKYAVGFTQIYTEKTATTLKNISLVTYPRPVMLPNFSDTFSRDLIAHGHKFVSRKWVRKTTKTARLTGNKCMVLYRLQTTSNKHILQYVVINMTSIHQAMNMSLQP